MHKDLFTIFGRTITTYGFLMAVGVLILALLFFYRMKKFEVNDKFVDGLTIFGLVAGGVTYFGCWFFDGLWHSLDTMMATGEPFKFEPYGITFEGGVFLGMVFFLFVFPLVFFKHKDKMHSFFYMDQIVIGILIAHCLGRIGCWCSGCCYGKVPTVSWLKWCAVPYPTHHGMIAVYPTQLIEAGFLFINFIIFFFIIKKNQTELYLIIYGVYRFFAEYLRGDSRGASPFGFITPSQLMSILFVILGVVVFFIRRHVYKKEVENEELVKNPTLRYYHFSLKGMVKGIVKPCNCPQCNKKMGLKLEPVITQVNPIELEKDEHFAYFCKDCNQFKEIEK